jgi:hypothetical protein
MNSGFHKSVHCLFNLHKTFCNLRASVVYYVVKNPELSLPEPLC